MISFLYFYIQKGHKEEKKNLKSESLYLTKCVKLSRKLIVRSHNAQTSDVSIINGNKLREHRGHECLFSHVAKSRSVGVRINNELHNGHKSNDDDE